MKRPHILVVDDNEEILNTLSIVLNRKDYRVSVKARIDNFEEGVTEIGPDLILLDKNLGWSDGCALCKSIKASAHLAHIPVIMFSAYYRGKQDCILAGADGFIEKPFEIKGLLQIIASFLPG